MVIGSDDTDNDFSNENYDDLNYNPNDPIERESNGSELNERDPNERESNEENQLPSNSFLDLANALEANRVAQMLPTASEQHVSPTASELNFEMFHGHPSDDEFPIDRQMPLLN